MAQQEHPSVAEAVIEEIDQQTCDESVHAAYARVNYEHPEVYIVNMEDFAADEGIEFTEGNAEEIADLVIRLQNDHFETLRSHNNGSMEAMLDGHEIEYSDDTPELTG